MAIKKCNECKKDVSSKAKTCPHCGAKQPSVAQGCAALIVLSLLAGGLIAHCSSNDDKPPEQASTSTPPPDAPFQMPSTAQLNVQMSINITGTNPLQIVGTTNLPDGTQLSGLFKGDQPYCLPHCGYVFENMTVKDGQFTTQLTTGPGIGQDGPLAPDAYTVDITTAAGWSEPENIQSIIGKFGENLRGPHIVTLESDGKYRRADFTPGHSPTAGELAVGLLVHFTQRIVISQDGQATPFTCEGGPPSGVDCNDPATMTTAH